MKHYLILFLIILGLKLSGQDTTLLALRDISPKKSAPTTLNYGLVEGDKIIINLSTNKNKTIDEIKISCNNKELFSKKNYNPTIPIELKITESGIVQFDFFAGTFGQDIGLKIQRIPTAITPLGIKGINVNTALQEYKTYDTTFIAFEIDSVVGYEEIKTPKKFRVISNADYESTEIFTKKFNIKGLKRNHVMITKPQEKIVKDDKEMLLIGYQVLITSAAGATKMWDAIATGVDVGCLALSFVLPAGGTAAGLAVETMFSMIAPQEGGEPVYYLIMNKKSELDKFLKSDPNNRPMVFETGLATGYSGNWPVMDTLIIGLENLNTLAEVDVSVAVFAIYQATTWTTITQDIITIKPKTVKVPKQQQYIKIQKYWNYQN